METNGLESSDSPQPPGPDWNGVRLAPGEGKSRQATARWGGWMITNGTVECEFKPGVNAEAEDSLQPST